MESVFVASFCFLLRINHIKNMISARTATPPMAIPAIAPAPKLEDDGAGSGVGDGVGWRRCWSWRRCRRRHWTEGLLGREQDGCGVTTI